jgi:hypothetical protein
VKKKARPKAKPKPRARAREVEAKRRSAAAKKAAETRKRNQEARERAERKAFLKRSRAAKKAAETRKRNQEARARSERQAKKRRSAAAKKAAATRVQRRFERDEREAIRAASHQRFIEVRGPGIAERAEQYGKVNVAAILGIQELFTQATKVIRLPRELTKKETLALELAEASAKNDVLIGSPDSINQVDEKIEQLLDQYPEMTMRELYELVFSPDVA